MANAVIIRDLPSPAAKGAGSPEEAYRLVEAEIEPNSTLRFNKDGSRTRSAVRRGDYATPRFLLVSSAKVKADPGETKLDPHGYPTAVTPRHLVVSLAVAALQFLEIEMPKIARKRLQVKRQPLHRGW